MSTIRTARRRRRTAAAGLACAAALLLSGCSDPRLGAAAVVDGQAIPVSDLQAATNEYLRIIPGGDPQKAQVAILQSMIISEVLDEVARDNGVRVPDGRVAAERDDLFESFGGRRGLVRTLANSQQQPTILPPSGVERWVKDRLLFNAIAEEVGGGPLNTADPESQQVLVEVQDQLTKAGDDLDIEVNPRYGSWSARRGITPLVSGGLATPLDSGGSDGS
jgi:hypothetical protein